MEIINADISDFNLIFSEIEKSFIPDERRDRDDALRLFLDKKYEILRFYVDGIEVGFITAWHLSDFVFFEHFVIYEKYRNQGYGAMALAALKNRFERMVLEAETPDTPIAKRRMNFYKRNGFTPSEHPYMQPAYRKNSSPVPLVIMSYPPLTNGFDNVVSNIYKEVYSIK